MDVNALYTNSVTATFPSVTNATTTAVTECDDANDVPLSGGCDAWSTEPTAAMRLTMTQTKVGVDGVGEHQCRGRLDNGASVPGGAGKLTAHVLCLSVP
jgi:hypothetical protein